MKYSYLERILWTSLSKTVFAFLDEKMPGINMKAFKKASKRQFKEIISRTPYIGSVIQNPLAFCLSGGCLWIAVWKASPVAMDETLFRDMVLATIKAPILHKIFSRGDAFSEKAIAKKMASAEKSMACTGEYDWRYRMIPGKDVTEYTVEYLNCGLCALGRQENCVHLIPHMCELDYANIELMGGLLDRTQTLAQGGSMCDFHITKMQSM